MWYCREGAKKWGLKESEVLRQPEERRSEGGDVVDGGCKGFNARSCVEVYSL